MKVNGDLKFRTLGSGELQNAIIERLASDPTGVAGRMYYNTAGNIYKYYDGTVWQPFAAGAGDVSNVIASGGYMNGDGTFNPAPLNALSNISGLTGSDDLVDALSQLDAAISTAAGVNELSELQDVNVGTVGGSPLPNNGALLQFQTSSSKWIESSVALLADDDLLQWDSGLNIWGPVAASSIGGAAWGTIALGGNTTGDTPITADTVSDTLNLAGGAGVSLAGIGASDTITVNNVTTSLADTAVVSGDVVRFFDGGAGGTFAYRSFGDFLADMDVVSGFTGTGIVVVTDATSGAQTFVNRSIAASVVAGDEGISIVDGDGVSGNPTVGLDIIGLADEAGTPSSTDSLAMFDGTNNVEVTVAQLASGTAALIGLDELNDVVITAPAADSILVFDAAGSPDVWVDSTMCVELEKVSIGCLGDVDATTMQATGLGAIMYQSSSAGDIWIGETAATWAGTYLGLADLSDINGAAIGGAGVGEDGYVVVWDNAIANNFGGTGAYTIVSPGSVGSAIDLNDLNDVTAAGATDGNIMYYQSGSPAGWVIGDPGATSGVQAQCDALDDFCVVGETTAADQFYYSTAAGTLALGTVTAAGRALMDDATAGDQRTTLGLVSGGAGDIWVEKTGDTMSGNLVMGAGTDVVLPDIPVDPTDAVNKAYVDAIVTAGVTWRDPIADPDLTGVTATEPAVSGSPIVATDNTTWIAYNDGAGTGFPQSWTSGGSPGITVVEYDVLTWDGPNGTWVNLGNIDGLDVRFGVNFDHGTLHSSLTSIFSGTQAIAQEDLVEFYGASGDNDPTSTGGWVFPDGRVGGKTFTATGGTVLSKEFEFATDLTPTFQPNVKFAYSGDTTGGTDATYTVVSSSFGAGTTTVVVLEAVTGTPTFDGSADPELVDGETVRVTLPSSLHSGQAFTYIAANDGWVTTAGSSTIEAGIGLSYSGSVLNTNLGAGIVELPTDEIGIDLHDAATGAIILTTDGTARSTGNEANLYLLLPALGGLEQDVSGLRVDVNTATAATIVTGDELLFSDASNINVPSKTTVASFLADLDIVNTAFTSSGFLVQTADDTYGTVTIADATNGGITVTNGDGGGNVTLAIDVNDLAALGGAPDVLDLMIVSDTSDTGTEKSIVVSDLISAINTATDLGDLNDVVITGSPAGVDDDLLVFNGTNWVNSTMCTELDKVTLECVGDVATYGSPVAGDLLYNASSTGILWTVIGPDTYSNAWLEFQTLSDVETGFSLTDGFLIKWDAAATNNNGGTGAFVPVAPSAAIATAELGDLSDVTVTSPQDGGVLINVPGSPQSWTNQQIQYIYDSTLGAGSPTGKTSHTIVHSLGQKFVNVMVYNTSDAQIIPQSVTLTDANTLVVTFNVAIDCTIVIMGVPGVVAKDGT